MGNRIPSQSSLPSRGYRMAAMLGLTLVVARMRGDNIWNGVEVDVKTVGVPLGRSLGKYVILPTFGVKGEVPVSLDTFMTTASVVMTFWGLGSRILRTRETVGSSPPTAESKI